MCNFILHIQVKKLNKHHDRKHSHFVPALLILIISIILIDLYLLVRKHLYLK
jgi:hypothetical protein